VNGGVLPELTYKTAIAAFGQHGAAELSYLVGLYALVSITLNTFDVPVPEASVTALFREPEERRRDDP
jgi:4-carboxymuconolactone decarboxylase